MFQMFQMFQPAFSESEKKSKWNERLYIYYNIYIIFNMIIYKYIIHPLLPPEIKP